jgi:hypothetical protein
VECLLRLHGLVVLARSGCLTRGLAFGGALHGCSAGPLEHAPSAGILRVNQQVYYRESQRSGIPDATPCSCGDKTSREGAAGSQGFQDVTSNYKERFLDIHFTIYTWQPYVRMTRQRPREGTRLTWGHQDVEEMLRGPHAPHACMAHGWAWVLPWVTWPVRQYVRYVNVQSLCVCMHWMLLFLNFSTSVLKLPTKVSYILVRR